MKYYLTKKGYDSLIKEIFDIKTIQAPKIALDIDAARSLGDLSENAEYHAAKHSQSQLFNKLSSLEVILSNFIIVDYVVDENVIQFGAFVKIENTFNGKIMSFLILDEYESNAKDIISINSLIVKKILKLKINDTFEFNQNSLTIKEISYDVFKNYNL